MLTNEQITFLDQFCEKKGVRYYDLRLEIVDHLATEIEVEMQQQADTDFPLLVQRVFESFGKNGFDAIVAAREASVTEEYRKLHQKYFRSFFNRPRITLTLLIIICLISPLFFANGKLQEQLHRIYFSMTVVVSILTISGILFQFKKPSKPLLLLRYIKRKSLHRNIGLLGGLWINNFLVLKKAIPHELLTITVICLVFVTMGYSLEFIARYQAVLKMYTKARREYPLAFMKKTS